MTPFDIINIINNKTLTDKVEIVADYEPWIVNRGLSNIMSTVFFSEEMAKNSHLPKDIQFDFYYYGIPKGKRFGKWNKKDSSEKELINIIKQIFCCNEIIAKKNLSLLSDEDRKHLLELEGGK